MEEAIYEIPSLILELEEWREPDIDRTGRGELYSHEIGLLANFAAVIGAQNVFEIGTHRGRTTLALAMNLAEGSKVWTLDVDGKLDGLHASDYEYRLPQDQIGALFKGSNHDIVQLWGDSREFDFSLHHDKMDLVLIDGAHEHDIVEGDLMNAKQMTREGGIYFCHDYHNWAGGCVAAIQEHAENHYPDGQAVAHFYGTLLVGFGEPIRELIETGELVEL